MHQGVVVDTWTKVSQKCIEDLCYLRLNFIQCEIVGSRIVQFKSYLDKLWQCSKEFQVIKKLNYRFLAFLAISSWKADNSQRNIFG